MRLSALAIVALSLIGALTARLWFLTAVEGEASVEAADANRTRTIHIQAPRGRIFDRNQRVLVDNRQVRQLRINPRTLDESVDYDEDARNAVFQRLADSLNRYDVAVEVKDAEKAAETAAEAAQEDPDAAAAAAAATVDEATWSPEIIQAALENNFIGAFVPTPVADEVPEDLEVLVAENQLQYPGVDVDRIAVRDYPHGTLAAHALGYVGPISGQEEIDDIQNPDKAYELTDEVGRSGVEATYEDWLRGTPGERVLEVDAEGNVARQVSYTPPRPGMDVVLSLDLQVQTLLEQQLTATAEANDAPGASGIVEDPRNGAIIAMASYPTYNPADLGDGLTQEEFDVLQDPDAGQALLNRTISGEYSPGSTFKPVTALAGLRGGIVTPGDSFYDDGIYEVQGCEGGSSCEFRNAGEVENGTVNLQSSLTVSSDWYYYRIGDNLWANRDTLGESYLQDTAVDWGFVAETGVDLPAEREGFAFTPAQVRQLHEDYPEDFPYGDWTSGNTINMSIGQGDLGVTPMQLTNAYAALANGGILYRPHVGGAAWEPDPARNTWLQDPSTPCVDNPGAICTVTPDQVGAIEIPGRWRDPMMAGLLGVSGGGGTAAGAFEGFDLGAFPIAGKTGTAQVTGKGDYALYVGFGPVRPGQDPEYVVSVIFEDVGQFGGDVAAPVARAVFDGLSNQVPFPAVSSTEATPVPSSSTAAFDTATTPPETDS